MTDRPWTLDALLPLLYGHEPVGGWAHIAVDDGNMEDGHLAWLADPTEIASANDGCRIGFGLALAVVNVLLTIDGANRRNACVARARSLPGFAAAEQRAYQEHQILCGGGRADMRPYAGYPSSTLGPHDHWKCRT